MAPAQALAGQSRLPSQNALLLRSAFYPHRHNRPLCLLHQKQSKFALLRVPLNPPLIIPAANEGKPISFLWFFLTTMVFWEGFVSDELMGTFAPIIVYWLYSGLYHFLEPMDRYRMHSRKEEEMRNLVPPSSVAKGVVFQQGLQAIVAIILFTVTGSEDGGKSLIQPSLATQLGQFLVAMLVMDTWQYFVHRYMHHNKFLYRHIHSQHHKLVVPYAFGALYNHPIEGLLLDTVGGAISFLVSGMTPRTSVFFFSFATIKTVDDHCGLWLPGNPFHMFFQNNTAYHDIHHQLYGAKYNFSQPFFVVWDKLLGTYMPYKLQNRTDGGFEARPANE